MTSLVHVFVIGLAASLLLFAYRGVARRQSRAASILGLGIAARGIAGSTLFLVSFLGLPMMRTLQSGDGFWVLAPDARSYFRLAADAASGMSQVGPATPSPAYVRTLAAWFDATGASPASAVLFNVLCFAAAAALLAHRPAGGRRLSNVPLIALAFAPLLVLWSSQVLKDGFFVLLVIVVFVAAANLYGTRTPATSAVRLAISTLGFALGVGFIAGIRAYFALIVWAAAVAAAVIDVLQCRRNRFWKAVTLGTLLAVVWVAFAIGSADYYGYYSDLSARATGFHFPTIAGVHQGNGGVAAGEDRGISSITGTLGTLRRGFVSSGGATGLGGIPGHEVINVVTATATGMLAVFVPISILKWTAFVEFSGGRGLLFVTDLDTVFMDVMIALAVIPLLRRGTRVSRNTPFLVFAVMSAVITTSLLAYVVTNFGTLVRLRLMCALPLWLLPLGVARQDVELTSVEHVASTSGPE